MGNFANNNLRSEQRNTQYPIPNTGPDAGLARSAGILSLGNIASRVIGLGRDVTISHFFGAGGQVSAFNLAARVPAMLYDLLVGGMLSAALVPVFSDYARPERRSELARVASAMLSLIAVMLGLVLLLLELFAEPAARLLGDFADPALQVVLTNSLRVIAPAILFLGLSGGVMGLLYALKRFSYGAFSGAVFNLGIVAATLLLAGRLGIYALPVGVVAGSVAQLLVMLPGLRDLRLGFSVAWEHPAVRRILRLYLPIALGLVITQVQIVMDGRWASAAGAQSASWMRYATTLIQMPLGLVPVAVSLAALPTLSQRAMAQDWAGFRDVFGRGLRLVLLLLIPATVALWALAEPVIRLLFEHGEFVQADTVMTAAALRLYLLGLLFAGVDFLLNYTFYARQDTRTPAIVGVIAVGLYFVAALALKDRLGFLGLVLADSVKQFGHAVLMILLLWRSGLWLSGQRVGGTLARAGAAALGMGALAWGMAQWLAGRLPPGKLGELALVGLASAVAGAFYVAALHWLGVSEVGALVGGLRAKLGGRSGRPPAER